MRRNWKIGWLLIPAIIVIGLGLLAACGEDATPSPKTDRVIIAIAPPGQWDSRPALVTHTNMWYFHPMYERLVAMDDRTGELIPSLATEWNLEPDGHSWRFKLRSGVKFHDGSDFTAEDVVFSWEQESRMDSPGSSSRTLRERVTAVEIVNDHEVVFRTDRPDLNVFELLAAIQNAGLEIMSKTDFEQRGGTDIGADDPPLAGTGPFMHKDALKDSFYLYERFDDYWNPDALPNFHEFEFRFIAEESSRLATLLAGEVHGAKLALDLQEEAVRRGMAALSNQVPGLRVWVQMYCCYMPNRTHTAEGLEYPVHPDSPLMDVLVRKALNKAIDRDAINEAFYGGKGIRMVQHAFSPSRIEALNPEWNTRWEEEYGYDPEAARQLLAEAGYGPGNPFQTNFHMTNQPTIPSSLDVAEAISNMWRAVGVEVNQMTVDPGERKSIERALGWDNHFVLVWSPASEIINLNVYHTSLFGIYLGWQHPTMQDLVGKLMTILEPDKQDPLLKEVGSFLYEQHGFIPLHWLPVEVTVNPEFIKEWIFPGLRGPVDSVWNIRVTTE